MRASAQHQLHLLRRFEAVAAVPGSQSVSNGNQSRVACCGMSGTWVSRISKIVLVPRTCHHFLWTSRFGGRLIGFLILTSLLVSGTPPSDAWLIVLGGTNGAITASTTRRDLVRRYGEASVSDQDVDIGEGETEPGTVLFPHDSHRSIDILWKDPETKLSPKCLTIRGGASL